MRYVHKLFSGRHAGRPAAVLTVALGLGFACSEAPTEATLDDLAPRFAKGGKPGKQDPPPGTALATFTLQPSLSDGLFQSGPFANEPLDEALIVDCDQGDDEVHTFVLERPADWGPLVPGDQIHCSSRDGFSRLDLNDMTSQICLLSDFPQGCQIGTDGHDDPDGFNFGPDLNYYFRVIPSGKKGGKGKFTSYNVVWIDARFTSAPPASDGIVCSWHLWATEAEFWVRTGGDPDVPFDGMSSPTLTRPMALDVVVTRQDCP